MAKKRQLLKINDFSGGLNNNFSSTNINENEATTLTNLKTDKTGTLQTVKDAEKAVSLFDNLPNSNGASGQSLLTGRGIFGVGADNTLENNNQAGAINSDEFLTFHPVPANYSIDIHSKINKGWKNSKLVFYKEDGDRPTSGNMIPAYYVHNGSVRVCDSDFSHDITPRYHQYINKKFFKNSSGTVYQNLEKWQSGNATIKKLEDLGIKCQWVDTSFKNPVSDVLGNNGTITLGVRSASKMGAWNGQYKFGITAMYNGQEGPISEVTYITDTGTASTDKYIYLDRAAMQVELYLTVGTTKTGIDDNHLLNDDRIDALRVYVQREQDQNWYKLFETSLEDGHKTTNWLHDYNSGTDTLKGVIASGNITHGTYGAATGSTEHDLIMAVDFGNNEASMDGETFTLVAQGYHQTPTFKTFKKGTTQVQDVTLNVINPQNNSGSNVSVNFRYTLLNQNFMPIMTKNISKAITSNDEKPVEFGVKQKSNVADVYSDWDG